MTAWSRALALSSLLLCGCTVMSEADCRSADWYQLGYRDADLYGRRPQIELYAYQCRAWIQAAESEYMRGWVDGYRELVTRVPGCAC